MGDHDPSSVSQPRAALRLGHFLFGISYLIVGFTSEFQSQTQHEHSFMSVNSVVNTIAHSRPLRL